ncbi:hypothetical protein KDW_38930 [Dictyobacter vulcani]|uniref:Pentapeptide repeat-containing protein n=1 Tax=Dictyobacter vulcani TaxID=2607529 RepID=A0A5J4KTE3_9CHLR|nr:pentapeptide repeat-containing protein [Dictyobacter vulcani]GER89731.1 hypothetical protein KDW_38930 [Dictyobacter vulcani]
MANLEHVEMLYQGVVSWNEWRIENPNVVPDLRGVDLSGIDLSLESHLANLYNRYQVGGSIQERLWRERQLHQSMLRRKAMRKARSSGINLSGAMMSRVNLGGANLYKADLSGADLTEANLRCAFLTECDLNHADLSGSDLGRAAFTGADLSYANLTGCFIYAISAWDVTLDHTIQSNLVITRPFQSSITVDNIEVAQFIYLLLSNEKIRHVIDTITAKMVLILGRFTKERKEVLDAIRDELRQNDYLPVIFDFEKSDSHDLTQTVSTLAQLAHFIIADLTDPSSIPYEMATIVPNCFVPVQPLILRGKHEFAMFKDLRLRYHWVLPTYRYADKEGLLASIRKSVIKPAEQKARELVELKNG